MNEEKTETGFTYVLSELLEFRLDQLMGNEKKRITSDHSYNHYGVTIMGLGDSAKVSKKITDFFRKLEFSEQEKELFTALLNDKMNRLRKLEKFEIECDKIYFNKLKLNWQRYPEQPMTLAKLESFLVKHKSLVTISLLSSLKRKNVGPQKTRSTPIGHRKVFINRQSPDNDAVEYLIYIPLPQIYASIDNLLNVSAYVTREEFSLFNDLKYKAGLFYHFRVKVMKVEGAAYLKIKFTSALTNRAFITKYIQNFDLEKELMNSKGYYQKTRDPISLNREKLLRMVLD